MNIINTETYKNSGTVRLDTSKQVGLGNLSVGDIISGTLTESDGKKSVITMDNGKSFRVDAKSVAAEIGERISFEIADVHGNSVVMKQINEEKMEETEEAESAGLTGEELLNWAKGAVLPITGAAFASSKIAAEQNAENNAKMLDALNKIKRDILFSVNNISNGALSLLAANGISTDSVTLSMISAAVKSAVAPLKYEEISEADIAAAIENYSKNNNEHEHREVFEAIQALAEEDLPPTDTNIDALLGVRDKLGQVKEMTEADKLSFLKKQRETTLDNLFTAIHSAGNKTVKKLDEAQWNEVRSGVEKYMISSEIPINKKNLDAARALIANDIPVTAESVGFFTGAQKARPATDVVKDAARNISEGKSVINVNIYKDNNVIAFEPRKLFESYKSIIKELPEITDDDVKELLDSGETVTIAALISERRNALENGQDSDTRKNENNKDNINIVSERIKLEEIRLRLTITAAKQMARAGISIDTMELQAAIDSLKAFEKKTNEAALNIAGAEASKANIDEMSERSSKIRGLSNTYDIVKRGVMSGNIPFNAESIAEANERALERTASERYSAAETAPNAKFGDSVAKVLGKVEELLESIGIEAFPENAKAARSLVRAGLDITKDNIEAIKAINNKIENVTQNLHPVISAQMIKDSFNPLTAHIDEVISYIDAYNETYGEPPVEAMERAILNMDKSGALSKNERDSLIGMYRMMAAINKNESVAAAIIAKSGKSLTLENLMESGKYYAKSGARRSIISMKADDSSSVHESDFAEGSIREQLGRAYDRALTELAQSGVTEEKAVETAQQNNLGLTESNLNMMKAVADSEMELSGVNINTASNIKYDYDRFLSRASGEEALIHLKTLGTPENTDIRQLIEGMNEFFENNSFNEARLNMTESAAFSTFKDDLKSLAAVSPQQLAWMMSMNLPLTISNIKTVSGMSGERNYLGKRVEEFNKLAERIAADKLEDEIPGTDLSALIDGMDAADVMSDMTQRLDEITEKSIEAESVERAELLSQASAIESAAKIMNKTGDRFIQLPIKLHDKIGSLNVYVLNREADSNNMNAFMRLDMTELGTVQAHVNLMDGFADIVISAENAESAWLMESNSAILKGYLEEIGIQDYRISFTQEERSDYFGGEQAARGETAANTRVNNENGLDVRL